MTQDKGRGGGLFTLIDELVANVEARSDAEILAEAAADGVDIDAETDRVTAVLLRGVHQAKRDRLVGAAGAHALAVARLGQASAGLPATASARRAKLERIVKRAPDIREALTLQFRDFESISDADVESTLVQLQHLGELDDEPEPGDE